MKKVRPARRSDLVRYFPDGVIPYSCRAVAVEDDGETVGVGGVYWDGNYYVAFSHIDESLKRDKRVIILACREAMKFIQKLGLPVFAIPDTNESTCDTFIRHFGFEKENGYYVWHSWQQQPRT